MSQRAGATAYSALPTDEPAISPEEARQERHAKEAAEVQRKRNRKEMQERIATKMHAVMWVVLAGLSLHWTDAINVIFNSDDVSRVWLDLAVAGCAVNSCIAFYLTLYLPKIAKIDLPWEVYCPRMIPTATGVGVATYFL